MPGPDRLPRALLALAALLLTASPTLAGTGPTPFVAWMIGAPPESSPPPEGAVAHGLVLAADGSPVAGGRARLVGERQTPGERPWHPTDDDGRFEIAGLAAGRYDLTADGDGHAPLDVPGVTIAEGEAVVDLGTVVLDPQATIGGRLVDDLGAPVAGGRVAVRFERSVPLEAVSDDDGRFTLGSLPAGRRVRLDAVAPGHAAASSPPIEAPAEGVELTLPRGATLAGVVVDREGRPQAGQQIYASVRLDGAMHGSWTSDSDGEGRFEFRRLPPGDVDLTTGTVRLQVAGVEPGGRREGIRLVVPVEHEIHGRVTDAAGRPLAAAHVVAERRRDHGGSSRSIGTQPDGGYRFTAVEGSTLYLTAHALGHAPSRRRVVVAADALRQDFALDPARGGELRGRVIGDDLTGVLLRLRAAGEPVAPLARLDEDGRFSFGVVSPGRYRVTAFDPPSGRHASAEVMVAEGSPADVELVLAAEPKGVLTGVVWGLEPRRLAGLRVVARSLGGPSTRMETGTDFAGRFRLPIAPGTWQLDLADPEASWRGVRTVEIAAGEEVAVEIDLAAGATLAGEVRLNGEPLADADLDLTGPRASRATTDWQGRFRFTGLVPGSYVVAVAGYAAERRVEVSGDRELEIDLTRAVLAGRVVDAAGEPVAGARVALPGLAAAHDARTDAAGRYRLPAPPGEHRVVASAGGWQPAEIRAEAFAGGESTLPDLVLTRGGTVVLDLGPGAAFLRLAVGRLDAAGALLPAIAANADENGRAIVDGLPAGGVRLLVAASGRATTEVIARVPGPVLRLDLPPAARIELTVPELTSLPLGASARITGADGRAFQRVTPQPFHGVAGDAWPLVSGHAVLESLPAGTWTVTVEAPDGRTWSAATTVAAGATSRLVLGADGG